LPENFGIYKIHFEIGSRPKPFFDASEAKKLKNMDVPMSVKYSVKNSLS